MPTLDIKNLIRVLQRSRGRLYDLYVASHDFGIADALLNECIHIDNMITQLRKLVTPE